MATNTPTKTTSQSQQIIFWLGVLVLFSIVHFTKKWLTGQLDLLFPSSTIPILSANTENILAYQGSMKGLLFLVSTVVLSVPVWNDVNRLFLRSKSGNMIRMFYIALGIALLLACLSFSFGNQSMGVTYAKISEDPFVRGNSRYSARLLMPALAHILFFRGNWLYFLFSLAVTIGLIAILYSWNQIDGKLSTWQFLSLCTCSFILFQFQSAGYPDGLVFIFYLLVMHADFSDEAKLSMLILALVTHEASFIIGVILAWRYLRRRESIAYLSAITLYGVLSFITAGFTLQAMNQYNVSGMSGFQWVLRAPFTELLGIFFAFKTLWAVIFLGIVLALRHKKYFEAGFITATMAAGGVMTFLAVDTSRMMGFAFPGLLIAIPVIRQALSGKTGQRFFSVVFLLNIIVPSFSVGLNDWLALSPGLYQHLYSWLEPFLASVLISH